MVAIASRRDASIRYSRYHPPQNASIRHSHNHPLENASIQHDRYYPLQNVSIRHNRYHPLDNASIWHGRYRPLQSCIKICLLCENMYLIQTCMIFLGKMLVHLHCHLFMGLPLMSEFLAISQIMSQKADPKGDRGKAPMYAMSQGDTFSNDETVDSFRDDDSQQGQLSVVA